MKRTCLFGKFLAAVACMLSVVLNVQAQETVFVFEGTATGDFAAAHSATDFSAYEQTTLKVSGPLNGADINAIRTAVASHFTSLDLSAAQMTAEGSYVYSGSSTRPMKADRIAPYMFYNLASLQSVVLPVGVTHIEDWAFQSCDLLESVTLNDALTDIGTAAFKYCNKIADITIPASVTSIGNEAFMYCYNIAPAFADGSQLAYIGKNAFNNCNNTQQITLPNTVTSIGESAFGGCSALTTINIPTALTAIPSSLFSSCEKLNNITIPAGVQEIGDYAFSGCKSLTAIVIPAGVKDIPVAAFKDCNVLESITLPATVTSIGNGAFRGCASLSGIVLPANLETVGSNAFQDCSKFQAIEFPESVTSIGSAALSDCSTLTDVKLPSKLTAIAANMFQNCTALESVTIPTGVATLGNYAFSGCNLLKNVSLPATVTAMGSYTFQNCTALETITLPNAVKTIPAYLFYGCTGLKTINMASDITSVGNSAFYNCSSITGLDFSAALETIGTYAFQGCTSLEDIKLSTNLSSVGTAAFYGCSSLKEVTLPNAVKVLPGSLFYGCTNLKTENAASDLTQIGDYVYRSCTSLEGFDIPSTVTSIGNQAFRDCAKITSLNFPAALTAIPDGVCNGCTSLVAVSIPETVTKIGSNAFESCTSLREVELPANLQTIKNSAFRNTALVEVVLPPTVTTIEAAAFGNCDNLITFTVNEGCTSVKGSPSVWDGCDNLTAIYLPSTITTLYYGTFSGIANLREVHVKMTEPINPNGGNYSFGKEGCTLYVPQGTADAYKAHSYWNLRWTAIVEEDYTLASLTDDEWNILKQIPALTGGDNWKNKWVFAETKEDAEIPKGVTISNGHVASIILTDNNLTGSIPYIIFTLPAISSIDLSNNSLTGDIGGNPNDAGNSAANIVCTSLTSLNISNNELTGDLYRVMDFAPNLTVLRAGYNKIRDISGILPVYTLEYHGQDLSDIYSVNYSDLYNLRCNPDDATSVPTVFTYWNIDKSTAESNIDSHNTYFYVNVSDNPGDNTAWYMTLTKRVNANSGVSYYSTASWCDGWYTRPTGNTLYAAVGTVDWEDCHKFNIVLDYEMGDVNFDTELNITDMQRTLNYALDSEYYHRYTPFNFTAANIIDSDNTINVQDVVANINILLNEGVTPRLAKGNRSKAVAQDEEPEAVLYVKDGELVLSTTRPVAALDIVLSGGNVKWSSATDFFSKKSKGNRTIVYSLFGDEIMEGETVLAEFDGTVTDAMLVDIDGNEIRRAIATGGFDGTTSIGTPSASGESNGAVYDLQGRKVADKFDRETLKPGIYIVGDKKIQL